ncbi:hypothetical protein A2572_04430 [Candidatus Collierbacteria bacterium RIFOXYD1_FULL_40_9]|uniref:DUF4345 domain-containing protein n=1 Tax=Candidatus Collierbacteria bacterium RIFOXYD1_FULL_40_9 TaxID=1817731 RepID=A0A1F5FPN0_9BACT|nr:MAG: hypothetical protein A2572_04430 [Candidatus Collierbacteria bacterium RIFOXYD1_FULL_40_9]
MKRNGLIVWISVIGIVGILFGIFYAFFGLAGLPPYGALISKDVITPWSNGLYGSIFIAFSVLLFFAGRHAFRKNDKELMKILLYGIYSWLIVEAAFSLYYGVYFNLGVDLALAMFLGYPLIKGSKE